MARIHPECPDSDPSDALLRQEPDEEEDEDEGDGKEDDDDNDKDDGYSVLPGSRPSRSKTI